MRDSEGFALLPSVLSEHRVIIWAVPNWPEMRWLLQDPRWAGFMESAGLSDILAQQRQGLAACT
jgi:hypothetical protein